MDKKLYLLKSLPILLTFLCLVYALITYQIDLESIFFDSNESLIATFLISFIIVFVQNYLMAKRWLLISKFFGQKTNTRGLFYAISYSSFLNQFLPATIAGDAYRSFFQKSSGSTLYKGISSVLVDRIIGLISLLVIACISILFLPLNNSYQYLSIFFLTSFFSLFFINKKMIFRFMPQKINTFLDIIFGKKIPLKSYNLSFLSHLISILLFIFVCKNNGFDTSELIKIGLIFPISLLLSTLPISIGGWGIREGSLLFLSSSLGLDTQNIILSSVQFGIILALTGLSNSIFIIPLSKIRKK